MKKFVIHTTKGLSSVIEVECEEVNPLDDPMLMMLPKGEGKLKITTPSNLAGQIWYSLFFYNNKEEAMKEMERFISEEAKDNKE